MSGMDRCKEPLLNNGVKYYDDCPGCKMDLRKATQRGYPLKELVLLALLVLCNSLPITSLFPFLYFMVRDFHIGKTQDIGYYAGYLGSSFMFGRFLTSTLWGMAADKYGRKPVMIICVASGIILNTLFGLSDNFWMAISTRFLLGSFNGLLGPVKAYASEVCKEEHQALGLSIVGTMWGIGLIIGPALGGFLAQFTAILQVIFIVLVAVQELEQQESCIPYSHWKHTSCSRHDGRKGSVNHVYCGPSEVSPLGCGLAIRKSIFVT